MKSSSLTELQLKQKIELSATHGPHGRLIYLFILKLPKMKQHIALLVLTLLK